MNEPGKIYCVGGAVRDRLLGLPVKDQDWVVTGSTPEQMAAQGFVPVGKDFPVFCIPKRMRNMRWRAQSAKRHWATMVFLYMPHPM